MALYKSFWLGIRLTTYLILHYRTTSYKHNVELGTRLHTFNIWKTEQPNYSALLNSVAGKQTNKLKIKSSGIIDGYHGECTGNRYKEICHKQNTLKEMRFVLGGKKTIRIRIWWYV